MTTPTKQELEAGRRALKACQAWREFNERAGFNPSGAHIEALWDAGAPIEPERLSEAEILHLERGGNDAGVCCKQDACFPSRKAAARLRWLEERMEK